MIIEGRIVDLHARRIFPGRVAMSSDRIASIDEDPSVTASRYILPGFVDAHVHVESSMLPPAEFASLAVRHGTVAVVADPHEIANVCGVAGVDFMISNGSQVPFKFFFGAPSCVPATTFETAGAELGLAEVDELLSREEIHFLAEMMNWPGVLKRDPSVVSKIDCAKRHGKPIDGHAPGLTGDDARDYSSLGITTDHECFTLAEALDKIDCGMTIIIREGSAAKNYEALKSLIKTHSNKVMFCTDDAHPDLLQRGHINRLVSRALAEGFDLFDVLTAATLNPVQHYGLSVGLLQEGDLADFIVVDDLKTMKVAQTWLNGVKVFDGGNVLFKRVTPAEINNFNTIMVSEADLKIEVHGDELRTIGVIAGELITVERIKTVINEGGLAVAEPTQNLLKLVVKSRYSNSKPAMCFVTDFGLQRGAIASTVGHDSHNILAVGCNDRDLAAVINAVVSSRGGLAATDGERLEELPLPIAGLMSNDHAESVADRYSRLDRMAKQELGSPLPAPFMTLSFLALLVIPDLKLSDRGLFSGRSFEFVDPFI